MAKEKKEEPVVDNEIGSLKVKEKVKKQTAKNKTENNVTKVSLEKPVSEVIEQTVTKVNLDEPSVQNEEVKEEVVENNTDDTGVVELVEDTTTIPEQKEVQPEVEAQEQPVVEEVTEQEVKQQVENLAEQAEEAVAEAQQTGKALPENIQKLVDFMEDTGGSLEDYVSINKDYTDMDNQSLLQEYYKQTKPHLSNEEIDFVMEDTFSYDEELDDEKEIKRKKLAMKEQVAQARQHLESVKSKYYEDIKAGSKLTEEQQKAINFFNRYNEESESSKKLSKIFKQKSEKVFSDKFKGFEYNVGEKRFRFNVKDIDTVKTKQSDINNFIGKFLNEDNTMADAEGYHKGLFTAMNPDRIANHFYEQGKADAIKESIAKSKNVSMDPRQEHVENVNTSGFKVRALNDESSDYKFRIKKKN
tara:strand:+ start:1025 stop:2269 length:1245 start_codon:yes stop_codon:yes gene_type:complete